MSKVLNKCPKCGAELEYHESCEYTKVYKILKNGKLLKKRIRKEDGGSMEANFICCSKEIDMDNKIIFNGRFHNQNNCICDCCHEVGNVLMLNLPKTKFNKHGELQTKYKQWWICDGCRKALTKFLVRADEIKTKTFNDCEQSYLKSVDEYFHTQQIQQNKTWEEMEL